MRPGRGLDDVQQTAGKGGCLRDQAPAPQNGADYCVQQTAGKGGCLRGATAAGDRRKRSLDKLAHTLLFLTP